MSIATTDTSSTKMPWALVAACCLGMFAATASGSVRSPLLLEMAADFDVSLPWIANLFGVTSACWAIGSFAAGKASDRIGRRLVLFGALLLLAATMVTVANLDHFWLLVIVTAIAGLACGSFTATAMTEVSLRTVSLQHGRALGWVMSGQSLTLLIGIPASAWLGAHVGWRGVHLIVAGLAILAAVATFLGSRPTRDSKRIANAGNSGSVSLREAMTAPIARLFVALTLERVCFGLSTFYYPTYLSTAYDLQLAQLAAPLFGFALGNIIGTIVGGQVADRLPNRRVSFALAMLISGAFAIAWFGWQPGLVNTVWLGIGFSFFNAVGRPPLIAAMADVPPNVRGVIMGLNSSIASIGWLSAAMLGGWLYAGPGFDAFGPLMLVMCLFAAAVVVPDCRLWKRRAGSESF
ncbi:MAG: MFS transporter [Burkholderiaceae bacterium]